MDNNDDGGDDEGGDGAKHRPALSNCQKKQRQEALVGYSDSTFVCQQLP